MKPLLLPEMPELPEKAHGEPVGSYWNPLAHHHLSRNQGHSPPLVEFRIQDQGGASLLHDNLVQKGGVVSTGTVQSLECDRVSPGGDGERGGRVALVRRTRWREGAHDLAVDQHAKVLLGAWMLSRWAASKVIT